MAGLRANWKGFLKFGELSCPVALYTGASTSDRIAFHTINRDTGHRVRREFYDPETNKTVERDDQVKGFEVDSDQFVLVEPDEIAAAIPESNKTLAVAVFVPCDEIDTIYFDKPYFLAPAGRMGDEAFAVIREALRAGKVGALAHAVLFRRYRSVMIRAQGPGLVAHTLNFDYEVRSATAAFDGVPKLKIKGEMLELAKHIISTKRGEFDITTFDDRYEVAVAELIKAKLQGKTIQTKKPAPASKVIDLLEALRASAGATKAVSAAKPRRTTAAPMQEAS